MIYLKNQYDLFRKLILQINKSSHSKREGLLIRQIIMKRNRKFQVQSFEQEWTCPITSMPMVDPVFTMDGHSYQKRDISEWLKKQKTSPKTGLTLKSVQLIPNHVLKNVISKFQQEFKYEFQKICQENTELESKVEGFQEKLTTVLNEKKQSDSKFVQIKTKFTQLVSNSKKVSVGYLKSKEENEKLIVENQRLTKQYAIIRTQIKALQTLKSEVKSLKQGALKSKEQIQLFIIKNKLLIDQRIESTNTQAKLRGQIQLLKKQNDELNKKVTLNSSMLKKRLDDELVKKEEYDSLVRSYQQAQAKIKTQQSFFNRANQLYAISVQKANAKDNDLQKLQQQSILSKRQILTLKNDLKQATNKLQMHQKTVVFQNSLNAIRKNERMQQEKPVIQRGAFPSQQNKYNLNPSLNNSKSSQPFKKLFQAASKMNNHNHQKILLQPSEIRHILPFQDYFEHNAVLYDEETKMLDHSGSRINMEEFLKYNWSEIKTINLSSTQLDDKGFNLFANEAEFFVNLDNLFLWNNFIVNIEMSSLQKLKNCSNILFSLKGNFVNPLNATSKIHIKTFCLSYPTVNVSCDDNR